MVPVHEAASYCRKGFGQRESAKTSCKAAGSPAAPFNSFPGVQVVPARCQHGDCDAKA